MHMIAVVIVTLQIQIYNTNFCSDFVGLKVVKVKRVNQKNTQCSYTAYKICLIQELKFSPE